MSAALKEPELLTVRQAADLLHLDERTVRNHINRNCLRASKLPGGKGWLIRREDLLTALQSPPSQTPARPSGISAGVDPLSVEASGIIRRTNTSEGRARAIAVLDRLQAEATDTPEQSAEDPARNGAAIQFRHWNTETWELLEEGQH